MTGAVLYLMGVVHKDIKFLTSNKAGNYEFVAGTLKYSNDGTNWEYINFIDFNNLQSYKNLKPGDVLSVFGNLSFPTFISADGKEHRNAKLIVKGVLFSNVDNELQNEIDEENRKPYNFDQPVADVDCDCGNFLCLGFCKN